MKEADGAKMARIKFIGRHLMVKGEYVDAILSGEKRATIRLGIIKPRYEEVMLHGGGKPVAIVRIEEVIHKRVSELTDEDAKLDGFNSRSELIKALRRVYERVTPRDHVTILKFKVVRRIDPSELRHMPPVEVARIAMRYIRDELTQNDRRILEELLRTKSVRQTAVNLFGSIERRILVRRAINRAYKILKDKGII